MTTLGIIPNYIWILKQQSFQAKCFQYLKSKSFCRFDDEKREGKYLRVTEDKNEGRKMKYEGPSSQMTKYVESNLETGKKENTHTPEGRRERKGRIEEIKK